MTKTPKLDHVVKLDDVYLADTPDGMVLTTPHQHEAARFTAIGAFDMAEWARKVPRCDHERSNSVRAVRLKGPRVAGNRCTKCNGSGRVSVATDAQLVAADGRRKHAQKRPPLLPGPGKRPAGMLKPPKPPVRKGA